MNFKHFEFLLVLQSFISFVGTADEKDLAAPCDLSLTWINEFRIKLSWNPSKDMDPSCKVAYEIKTPETMRTPLTFVDLNVFLDKAVTYTVQTVTENCGNRTISKAVNISIAKPTELVKKFQCFLYSSVAMNCNWFPASQVPEDLQLYYRYSGKDDIAACGDYLYRDGERTGCHLRGDLIDHEVYFQVNGTLNGLSVRNTFLVHPRNNAKPKAPKVNITKEGNDLVLMWDPPNLGLPHCWDYILNYSRCQETLSKVRSKQSTENIAYDPRCQYRVQVKAIYSNGCGKGGSDWSEVYIYGGEEWLITVISVIIPASLFLFVILFLCCFMKHRENLFPQIPQPSLIFKDILNSSKEQMTFIGNLYVPVEDDVECKFSLEKEPQLPIMQPDS